MRLSLPTVLLLAAAGAAAAERRIMLGADLEHGRPEAARRLFTEVGMDCVRLTGGGFAWAAGPHAAYARELAASGVRVYLQLGSHYPSADYFPLTDAWLVDQEGRTGVEDRASWSIRYDWSCWPQYSYAHQGFRERLAGDFATYLAGFPPGSGLAGVILHNEPGMHWLDKRIFDYGAPSIAAFRAWLPAQHGSIAELNRRWGSSYAGFAEVEPPRHPGPECLAAWLDWRRFQVHQIAGFMAWEAGLVGRLRPDLARTTNLDGPTGNWYGIRCADLEACSRPMDTVGMDIYPTRWTDRGFVPYAADQLLGAAEGRRAEVLECEVFGPRSQHFGQLGEDARAALLRAQLWTILGHGADGALLWGFSRGDEFSLTDGEWNPRVLACRDIVRQQRMIGLGGFARPRPQVALCVDPDAYLRASALDRGGLAGGSAIDLECHGLHAALAAAGFASDVVMAAQLPRILDRYRALVLPAAPLTDPEATARLRAFVAGGGTVVAVAPCAAADRWGAALPDGAACAVSAGWPAEVRPAGDGMPALAVSSAGRGRFALLAGPVGAAFLAGGIVALPGRLAALLAQGGIAPGLAASCADGPLPDLAVLDGGADRLVVAAVQGGHGGAGRPARGVRIILAGPAPGLACAFPPTAVSAGVVRSGPVVLPLGRVGDASAVVLDEVASAMPVLLASDHGPLLALACPAEGAAGASLRLDVTCINPSPRELRGTVELAAGGTCDPMAVVVPPWGSTTVALACRLPDAAGRWTLDAQLRADGATVRSVPVDVVVRAAGR